MDLDYRGWPEFSLSGDCASHVSNTDFRPSITSAAFGFGISLAASINICLSVGKALPNKVLLPMLESNIVIKSKR